MITIYNRTKKPITEVVESHVITVPGNGSAQTSPRKGHKLVELHPDALSFSQVLYTDEERQIVDKLPLKEVRMVCHQLMAGMRPPFEKLQELTGKPSPDDGKK